jgi:hypothetical protein
MATIRVKCGGCGIKYTDANGNARHALKTPESGAFECDDAQADRLVGLGVAEYVGLQWREVSDEVAEEEPAPLAETQPEQAEEVEPAQETEKRTGHLVAEDLEKMSYLELKHLAAEMGIFPDSKKKADYIEALVAAEVEIDEDEDDDELPELCAADPE